MSAPLPGGFRIVQDPTSIRVGEDGWLGLRPLRLIRLSGSGRVAWRELLGGRVTSRVAGRLARRLTDAGLCHPVPPPLDGPADVTVVVPTKDRAGFLAECLAAQGHRYPVVVVDDGSDDPAAVAAVVARHRATLVPRAVNGGPAAARNSGLEVVSTEFVAFLDNDCLPYEGWIDQLLPHFADPLVAAVAPRMVGVAPKTWVGRYTSAHCALDLGQRAASVGPHRSVPYVPTAALIVRRAALPQKVFDPALRVGEDVDLVWRLCSADWRVRYVPEVRVRHQEPRTWRGVLGRRFRYGTSVAPLARRHPHDLPPLITSRWLLAGGVALLTGRGAVGLVLVANHLRISIVGLHAAGLPWRLAVRVGVESIGQSWLGMGRYGTQFAAPLLLALAAISGSRVRRLVATSLILGPPLASWLAHRTRLDPLRYVLAHVADDVAYGLGALAGCLRDRNAAALRPVIT